MVATMYKLHHSRPCRPWRAKQDGCLLLCCSLLQSTLAWTLEWGWKESEGGLTPVHTDLPTAAEELLRVIRCNYKTDCTNMRCTCIKHNVKCSPACGNCRGSGCINSDQLEYDDDDEEEVDNEDDNID